jgi:hypothetical protein
VVDFVFEHVEPLEVVVGRFAAPERFLFDQPSVVVLPELVQGRLPYVAEFLPVIFERFAFDLITSLLTEFEGGVPCGTLFVCRLSVMKSLKL